MSCNYILYNLCIHHYVENLKNCVFLKASAQPIRKSNALTSLTGNLGTYEYLFVLNSTQLTDGLKTLTDVSESAMIFKINLGLIFTLGLDVYDSDDNSSDADRDKDDDVDSDEELKVSFPIQ